MIKNMELQNCLLGNLRNFISIQLDKSNYVIWKFLVETLLKGCGLMRYIDGSFPCPEEYRTTLEENKVASEINHEYMNWVQNDSAVMSIVAATLSSDALSFVIGSKTSKEMWCRLKEKYVDTSRYNIMQLKSSLYNIRKDSDSIDKYLLRVKEICDQLDTIGVSMDDGEMIESVLHGLPSEFAVIKGIIRGKMLDSSVSMKELRSLLLIAEDEINKTLKSLSMSLETGTAVCGDTSRGIVHSHSLDNSCLSDSKIATSSSSPVAIILNTNAPTGCIMHLMPSTQYMIPSGGYSPSNSVLVQSQVNSRPDGSIQFNGGFVGSHGVLQQCIEKYQRSGSYCGQNKNNVFCGQEFKCSSDGSRVVSHVHNNQVTEARSSNTQSVCSSIYVCQICNQFGHFAGTCPQNPASQQVAATGSYMRCQICLKTGRSAVECLHKHYDFSPPAQEEPQVMTASFKPQSMAAYIPTESTCVSSNSSVIENSNGNASCYATSVSAESSEWQLEFLKQLAALSIRGPKQFLSKTTHYCRQASHPSQLCQSLPLISPG